MSAQETVALQAASTWVLMASITSYPRAEFAFGPAFFSPVKVDVSSSRIEPSHPYRDKMKRNVIDLHALHSMLVLSRY
jgi:hypothetical protein